MNIVYKLLTWECTRTWKSRAESTMSKAVVATFTMSAPVDSIFATRSPISSTDGVFW